MNELNFINYNYLGAFSPYYIQGKNKKIILNSNFDFLLNNYLDDPEIDELAIGEILCKNFIFGDRTILKGISRTPWMAKLNSKEDGWTYFALKKHGEMLLNEKDIAKQFFILVCKEIKDYVGAKKRIGILLSGGMDSRIVAGCLDYLIKTGEIVVESVTAFNWGNPDSRDVIYAKEIAKRLGWNYKHYLVDPDDLWENFKVSGLRGAEYSGVHLHAIPKITNDIITVDLMLAGSYGDSIGRGEYSGVKVSNLKRIDNNFENFGSFLKHDVYHNLKSCVYEDIKKYHDKFKEHINYQQYELDYQIHYMRRNLNSCVEILNETTPTHQVFTSPETYNFIWNLHPKCRTDSIYDLMMKLFSTRLNDIPWARTGRPYMGNGKPDSFQKKHHSYALYIQNDLLLKMKERALSERIQQLSIFNIKAIESIFNLIKYSKNDNWDYLEKISWLVSLDFFLEQHKVKVSELENNLSWLDIKNAYIKEPFIYIKKQILRKGNRKIKF